MRSFRVDEVEPAREPMPVSPLGERYPQALVIGGDPSTPVIDHAVIHPLLWAVELAFSEHRPLVLSPDAVWLTIAHGVAQHVRLHAGQLRHRLVRHDGRKELTVRADAVPTDAGGWASLVTQLRTLLAEELGEGRARLFECDFSTSTEADRLASHVVLLDAYSHYFTYYSACVCGIPELTLLGTVEDWRAIRARIDVIAELDLDFWCRSLSPIAEQFVRAAAGDIDLPFWQRIYNPKDAYGGELITGWITRLYPYVRRNGTLGMRNPMLELPLDEPKQLTLSPDDDYRGPGLRNTDIPAMVSRLQVVVEDQVAATKKRVQLVAGVVAVTQDDRGALRPIAGWHLEHAAPPLESVIDRIVRDHVVVKAPEESLFGSVSERLPTGPAEVMQLFGHIESATLFEGERKWRLRPPAEHQCVAIVHADHFDVLRIADLPGGRSLCAACDLSTRDVHWIVCRLENRADEVYGGTYIAPMDDAADIPVLGTSLAVILDAALASEGDIAHLEIGRFSDLLGR
jgi:hypothetical protein